MSKFLHQLTRVSRSYNFRAGTPRRYSAKPDPRSGPGLEYFLANAQSDTLKKFHQTDTAKSSDNKKVFISIYGCQMNVNDAEIVFSVLRDAGYERSENIKECSAALLMTCSVREGAEQKVWKHLMHFKQIQAHQSKRGKKTLKIGLLGCMAERLKTKILETDDSVDVICGPDAYRDLPRLLEETKAGNKAVNVQLSLEETYADILPVRLASDSLSAYVSIMRGCDNMCTYCIVPFTRGRERSRPVKSILEEVRYLSDSGVKEVVLLGQNVNSYRDTSTRTFPSVPVPASPTDPSTPEPPAVAEPSSIRPNPTSSHHLAPGFSTVYKPRVGGIRFDELLDQVSLVDPEMRIRFTSPHPKDFPEQVLRLIADRPNICHQLHLPAQSGSTRVLELMNRGYSREAYLQLVQTVRDILPGVALSSDFIAGFCSETEEDHQRTVDLMKQVKYNFAFCFPYSMRQKTRSYHRLCDDVPDDVKSRRHMELIQVFREEALKLNTAAVGEERLVLIDGESRRSVDDWVGRGDDNIKVIFPKLQDAETKAGDYVVVKITSASSQVFTGRMLRRTTLQEYHGQKAEREKCVL